MTSSDQVSSRQGRIDVPFPAQTSEPVSVSRPGAVYLDEQTMEEAQQIPSEIPDGLTGPAGIEMDLHETLRHQRLGTLGWGLIGIGGLSLLQLGEFIWQTLQGSLLWGGLWCLALVLVAGGALRALWRELRVLRQLGHCENYQKQAKVLQNSQEPDGARDFCRRLATETGMDRGEAYQNWLDAAQSHHFAAEQLRLYSQLVIDGQDRRARALISRWSGEAALLVAVSPLASVDMWLILWRSLKMIEAIAGCYGIRLGYWSRIRLLRLIVRHMLYAGAAELIADVGLDWLGAELSARLSARLAQGVGAGLLTARLGLQTLRICRPIAFEPDEQPGLGQIRRELVGLLLSRLGSVLGTGSSVGKG